MEHAQHHCKHLETENGNSKRQVFNAALHCTLNCLIGCGIGEIVGMIIGTALGMDNISRIILSVVLGFVFGFALGIRPLLKNGFSFSEAFKIVLIAEGLSVFVMETAEVLTEIYTPGVMQANLGDFIFWIGMLFASIMGFMASFPVNYFLIKKGVRSHH